MDPGWPGCHGVRICNDCDLGLGRCEGEPLLDATVATGPVARPAGSLLWSLGAGASTQHLYREPDGTCTLVAGDRARASVSVEARSVTVTGTVDPVQVQLVVSFAFPLLLSGVPAVVLHAAAAARRGRGVLFAGAGGAGKSSTLAGLVGAGWTSISEDVCCVAPQAPHPVAWPGPPWVRLGRGQPGPPGSPERFHNREKVAWDLSGRHSAGPVPVTTAVLLQAPGGASTSWARLGRAEAVAELASHAVWLAAPADRGRHLFARVVAATAGLDVVRVRLPFAKDWTAQLLEVLEGEILPPD